MRVSALQQADFRLCIGCGNGAPPCRVLLGRTDMIYLDNAATTAL